MNTESASQLNNSQLNNSKLNNSQLNNSQLTIALPTASALAARIGISYNSAHNRLARVRAGKRRIDDLFAPKGTVTVDYKAAYRMDDEHALAAELGITFDTLRYRRRQVALGLLDESLILHRGPLPASNGQRKSGEIGNAEWKAMKGDKGRRKISDNAGENAEAKAVLDKIPGATRWEKEHLNHIGAGECGTLRKLSMREHGTVNTRLVSEIMRKVPGMSEDAARRRELKYRRGKSSLEACFGPANGGEIGVAAKNYTRIQLKGVCPVTEGCATKMSAASFERTCRAKRQRLQRLAKYALCLDIKTNRCEWCQCKRERWPEELDMIEVDA